MTGMSRFLGRQAGPGEPRLPTVLRAAFAAGLAALLPAGIAAAAETRTGTEQPGRPRACNSLPDPSRREAADAC